jgi:hypothetical protein
MNEFSYDYQRYTLLGMAANENAAKVLEYLFEKGGSLTNSTPLVNAAAMGNTKIVSSIVHRAKNIKEQLNDVDNLQQAPALFLAAQEGHLEIVQLFVISPPLHSPTPD